MENIEKIIDDCRKNDAKAQEALYKHYSPLLFSICLRYMKSYDKAEDVLVSGFYKIFTKISSYKNEGSFEGWIKRVIVNEALMQLRKKNALNMSVELSEIKETAIEPVFESNLDYEQLLKLIDELPNGYRTVFNMYVIEGYKHREIAEALGVSINTSKSQLILAKRKLREMIKKKHRILKVNNE